MDELGTFSRDGDIVDLRYERRYPRPIGTVWAALTEPARLADWIGQALVEPHVGGRYELFIDRKRPMTGRILTWQPPTLLEFSWPPATRRPPSCVASWQRMATARAWSSRTRALASSGLGLCYRAGTSISSEWTCYWRGAQSSRWT